MSHPHLTLRAVVVALAALAAGPGLAGLQEGLDALRRGDYAAAVTELRPLADKGNPEAQYRVALMYEYGRGYPTSKTQAFLWLRKAADQGHAAAQTELAIFYVTGDGIAQDDEQAVAWFRKGAEQGNVTAQYNLGLLYAKGQGVKQDTAQAVAWFRKAADQGMPLARFKLGVAYENGEGVPRDDVRAYANYAVAAQGGNAEYAAHRDGVARRLAPAQLRDANAMVAQLAPKAPAPAQAGASGTAAKATPAPPAPNRCTASGAMEGEKFAASHCAAAVYTDQHSVAIWFSEEPIAAADADAFALSSYADGSKGGRQRTQLSIMLCPGGGAAPASAAAVKAIDFSTNHAKSALAGVQWVLEAPRDFKVERLTGEAVPGGRIAGRIVGGRARTSFSLDFDVALPAREAAAGLTCRR